MLARTRRTDAHGRCFVVHRDHILVVVVLVFIGIIHEGNSLGGRRLNAIRRGCHPDHAVRVRCHDRSHVFIVRSIEVLFLGGVHLAHALPSSAAVDGHAFGGRLNSIGRVIEIAGTIALHLLVDQDQSLKGVDVDDRFKLFSVLLDNMRDEASDVLLMMRALEGGRWHRRNRGDHTRLMNSKSSRQAELSKLLRGMVS